VKNRFLIMHMNVVYSEKSAIEITLNTIGCFLNSGALFYAPTVTKDLLEFHSNHYQNFQIFSDEPNSLYLPNNWIPHCMIAIR
jgi:hypothetical protein